MRFTSRGRWDGELRFSPKEAALPLGLGSELDEQIRLDACTGLQSRFYPAFGALRQNEAL